MNPVQSITAEEVQTQFDRIRQDTRFRSAAMLQKLLKQLVQAGLNGVRVKAEEIILELYGKHEGEWHDDSLKVLISNLRLKLAAYYAQEHTAEDEIIIEVPPGPRGEGYAASFRRSPTRKPLIPAELELLIGTFHHYHLTKDWTGQPIWIYKVLNFQIGESGRLAASASVMPDSTAAASRHQYHFDAFLRGPHLVVQTHRINSPSDISVEVFPYLGGHKWPLYSGRLNISWQDQLVTSISILSDQPLPFVKHAEPGRPIRDSKSISALQDSWERYSNISQLPRPSLTVEKKWNDEAVREALRNSPPNATIRMLTTFFTQDLGLLDILSDLLINSTRRIEILMIDPGSDELLKRRYGARNTLTVRSAKARINAQLEDLERRRNWLTKLKKEKNDVASIGSLEVLVYSTLPTLVSYQIHEEILVGLLFSHTSADNGPLIKVQKNEPLWNVLQDNWKMVRSCAVPPKQRLKKYPVIVH